MLEATTEQKLAIYQFALVQRIMAAQTGDRIGLLAPPGYGKSTALIAAVARLSLEKQNSRILVVAPSKPSLAQWAQRLSSNPGLSVSPLDASTYTKLELGSPNSVLGHSGVFITTGLALARRDRASTLAATTWDLLVLDDVIPNDTTVVGRSLRQLWNTELVRVAITAGVQLAVIHADFTRIASELIVWDRSVLESVSAPPSHEVVEVRYAPTRAETEIRQQINGLIGKLPEDVANELRLRSSQSFFAVAEFIAAGLADTPTWSSPSDGDPAREDEATSSTHPIPTDVRLQAEDLLESIEQLGTDTKLEALGRVFSDWDKTSDRRGILVSVRRRDTADYLAANLRARYGSSEENGISGTVLLLTGDLPDTDRAECVARAHTEKRPILVATDASSQGFDFPAFTDVVHFDLPRSLESLWIRINRLGLLGRKPEVIRHFVLTEEGEDNASFARAALRSIFDLESAPL